MIKSFTHKGLQRFYNTGSTAGIIHKHKLKLELILGLLETAELKVQIDLPGLYLYKLKGKRKDIWSVKVSGNWRVTFRFIGTDVEIVNYEDYH